LEWSDPRQKASAVATLVEQLDALEVWILEHLPEQAQKPPLAEHLETIRQLREQDLEPDPSGGGPRIRHAVAEDRRVSVTDKEMRHGRKSKSKRFNGYKRTSCCRPRYRSHPGVCHYPRQSPEDEAVPNLRADIVRQPRGQIGELFIDRGYVGSDLVTELIAEGYEVVCKPWVARNGSLFSKRDFKINMRDLTITCPRVRLSA